MRGVRGKCLCKRAELLIAIRDRIAEKICPEAFPLRGYELADLGKQVAQLDALCTQYEEQASDAPDGRYARLSLEELDSLNELLSKASEGGPVPIARGPRCEHVELAARVRDKIEETLTGAYALEGYEVGRLASATLALEKILRDIDEREGETLAYDLGRLTEAERATVERLTAKVFGSRDST